ncbi:hypothetical protein O181_121329 [Austropuccinia psidii MF-1]|uniref:Uncharacterized protein n=1 Tax=Austropuccinia psidii MF-1 TaxID=1389203 RepID=A0A9Q3Q198_9BASI|nr:hypothetical protein [Austropuccinia psidii MF-1]
MSPVYLRDLGFQMNQPEDREDLSRTRRPGRGHLGHSGGWQNNEGDNINPSIHTPIQWRPQTRGLERHRSSSSAPPTPQESIPMEHGRQKVQLGISLGRTLSKLPNDLSQRDRLQGPYGNHQRLKSYQTVQTPGGKGTEDKGESSHYPSYRRTVNPDGAYSDYFRLTRTYQWPRVTIIHNSRKFLGEDKETRARTEPPSTEEERVRPYDPEAFGFGKRSTQEPEVVANHSRFSSPINRNITPTQIEHKVVRPDINLKSDELWLEMSQSADQSQKQFAELEASHERMKKLTASMDKIVKTLQEGNVQLRKASDETNKRLNLVFEEQNHKKGTGIVWIKT